LDADNQIDAEFVFRVTQNMYVVANETHYGRMHLVNGTRSKNVFVVAQHVYVRATDGINTLGNWVFAQGHFESSDRVLFPSYGAPWTHRGRLLVRDASVFGDGMVFGAAYVDASTGVNPFETETASGGHSTYLIAMLPSDADDTTQPIDSTPKSFWDTNKNWITALLVIICVCVFVLLLAYICSKQETCATRLQKWCCETKDYIKQENDPTSV
jgi:hypothetical protein